MKKNVLSLGLIVLAALTLFTNCSKNEFIGSNNSLSSGDLFEITLTSEVKTTNNGMSTEWADGDAVNVFHAVAGTTDYVNDGKFDVSDAANGTFTGTLNGTLDSGKSYDWYVFYPYSSYITTPNNTSAGYSTVAEINQTQTGNNNTAHLKALPLAGKTTGVSGASSPSISMLNMASVIKVVVTNNSGVSLPVTTIKITTSSEKIAGRFYVNFVNPDSPVYTPATGSNSPSTAVNLKADQVIANASSATFFVAVRPFTAENGTTLKLKVEDYEKTSSITSNKVFKPGEINTFNFNYDKEQSIASLPFNIDGTGGYAAYSSTTGMSSSGVTSDYTAHSPYLAKFDSDGDYVQVRFNEAAGKASIGVKMVGGANTSSFSVMGSADGITFTEIESLEVSGAQNATMTLETTRSIDAAYRYIRFVFDKGSNVGVGAISITKPSTDPEIQASNIANVPAIGVTTTTTYTVKNFSGSDDVTATCDGTVVTAASVTSSGTVSYTVAPNYTTSAAQGTITLSSVAESINKVIAVSQLAEELESSTTTLTLPKDASSGTFTITVPTFAWATTVTAATGMNLSVSPTSGSGSGDAQTITVSSTTAATETEQTLGTVVVYRGGNASDPQAITVTVKKAASSAATYRKVSTLTSGRTYLIVNAENNVIMPHPGSSASTLAKVDVKISNNEIVQTSSIQACEFVITATTIEETACHLISFTEGTSTYYVTGASKKTSLGRNGTAPTTKSSYAVWSIATTTTKGSFAINNRGTNNTGRYIEYRSDTGVFGDYSGSPSGDYYNVDLFELQE